MKLSLLALLAAKAAADTCLTQADFDGGTYVISTPGVYKLCSDIVFGPNGPTAELSAAEAFDPPFIGEYDENEVRRLRCFVD